MAAVSSRLPRVQSDGTAAGVEFRVLGPVEIMRDGRTAPLAGAKQRSLLALFLLRPNRFIASEWLVDALWDGQPPPSARVTLRTYVAGIRRALEVAATPECPVLVSHGGGYELRVDARAIDAVRFTDALDHAAVTLAVGDPGAAELAYTTALEMWRGEPLADVADLSALRAEAGRLDELRLDAEEGRLTAAVAAGRHEACLADLRHFVASHPLRETARAQFMTALHRSGRQAEALAVYDEGRRLLASEYGIDPGEQLRRAHQTVLGPAPLGKPAPVAESPPSGLSTIDSESGPVLFGRDRELERLTQALTESLGAGGRVAIVVGEPGIGKTSLVAELARHAERRGTPLISARCPDVGQAPPYWLWRQVVRTLVSMSPAEPLDGSVARLAGFADTTPVEPDEADVADPAARFRAYEAVATLVRTVAARRGLLIILDDIHAADPDSLLLLRYLSLELAGAAALVVAATRPYEYDPALATTVAELARQRSFTRLPLDGLDTAAVSELVRSRTGEDPSEPVVERLVSRTGGNPFFITELLRSGSDPAGAPTASIRDAVRSRLDVLPRTTRSCLDLLAVAGRELDVGVMVAVLDVRAPEVAQALAAAFAAALVAEDEPGTVRFRHALFAEVTYTALAPPQRAVLHAQLAMAYERSDVGNAADVAYHYGQAIGLGHTDDHVRWSLRAADEATRRLAYEDALAHLDHAARALSTTGNRSPQAAAAELAVHVHRAALLQMTTGVGSDAAGQACTRARELLAISGAEADLGPALWALGELAANRADFELCADLARRLAETDDDGSQLTAVAADYLRGVVDYFAGRLAASETHLTAAIDRLRRTQPSVLRRHLGRRPIIAAFNFRALVRSLRGETRSAHADIADARTLAVELDDRYGQANAALYAAWVALQEQDVATVAAEARRCRTLGEANGLPHFVTTSAFLTEWAEARSGDLRRLPAMREAGEEIYRAGLRSTRTITLAAMAEAYLAAGDRATAEALAQKGLVVADSLGEQVFAAELYRVLGQARPDPEALLTGARLAAEQGAALLSARLAAAAL